MLVKDTRKAPFTDDRVVSKDTTIYYIIMIDDLRQVYYADGDSSLASAIDAPETSATAAESNTYPIVALESVKTAMKGCFDFVVRETELAINAMCERTDNAEHPVEELAR